MVNIEAFKKEGYSFEEIHSIIDSEKKFEKTGISYSLNESFSYIKSNIFSKSNKEKCMR